MRVLKNRLVTKFKELEKNNAAVEEMEALGRGKLYMAAVEGDVDYGSVTVSYTHLDVYKRQRSAYI